MQPEELGEVMVGPRALGLFKKPNQTEPRLLGRSAKPISHLDRALLSAHGQHGKATSDHVIGLERDVYGPRWEGTTDG